jgi:predicted small secreted protein
MKTSIIRIISLIVAAAMVAIMGASCRTVHGFGQDVDSAGDHIQHASR